MPTDTVPTPPNALLEQLTVHRNRARNAVELVELAALTRKVQLRETTDAEAVARYAQAYLDGEQLPPIVVFRDGDDLYLADGHHRVAAAKRAKLCELHAIVKKGDRRAATLYAAGANGQHGLPLTNADKRKIVATLLGDDEWKTWSNREIGRVSRTSEALVRLIRKELGAEISEIKRKDGTKQKTRNADAKKPKQQSLLDPYADEKAMVDAHWNAMRQLPGAGSIHETKARILASLYFYNQVKTPGADPSDCACSRKTLELHIGRPVDVHAGQLCAAGKIDRADNDSFVITRDTYHAIDRIVRGGAKDVVPHNPSVPAKTEPPPALPPLSASSDLGRDLDRCIRQAAAMFAKPPAGPTSDDVEKAADYLGIDLGAHWFKVGIDGIQQDFDGGWHTLREDPAPAPAPAAGPEEITAPVDPKPSPEIPAAAPSQVPALRPLGLRRVDKQREILSRRLLAGKLNWTGSDDDLFLLARIAGVPSAPTAWIDAARATARVDFLTALSRECADRVRSGECMNGRKWPQLAELCRLWDIDHQAIEIEAERAVPA